jgi:hypothetical protein
VTSFVLVRNACVRVNKTTLVGKCAGKIQSIKNGANVFVYKKHLKGLKEGKIVKSASLKLISLRFVFAIISA